MVGVARSGQRSYDYQATGGEQGDSVAHQMAQSALHRVAHDRATHGLAHDETRTCPGSALPRRVRVRGTATKVYDEERASCPTTSSYRGREILAPPQPMLGRQHDVTTCEIRRTGWRDPCCGGSPGSRDRHGCASAGGSRGSWRDDGCSAGRCACSLGGSRNQSVVAGCRPGCHRAPTSSSRYARVHRFPITETRSVPIGGRRQQPSTTRPGYGTRG